MKPLLFVALFAASAFLWSAATVSALDAGPKCEAAKNKIAGKYAVCRQKAEAKAIKTAGSPDYMKCDAKFSQKWGIVEAKGGGRCPTAGDEAAMQLFITTHANTVATALSGAGLPTCGDNTINVAGEQCDGTDLGGETCVTLGFSGGTLACSSCSFDTTGCTCGGGGGGLPETGYTQCDQGAGTLGACPGSPAGQDGALRAGATRSYTDNGDGTITDNVTGLMWEKLDDNNTGGIHDQDNTYTWYDAFNVKIATLNSGGGFAGHTDWRLPNSFELYTLLDLGRVDPAIDPAFNTSCAPSCTVTMCSCTPYLGTQAGHWSSTSYQVFASAAWIVGFNDGHVGLYDKNDSNFFHYVRAVRGRL